MGFVPNNIKKGSNEYTTYNNMQLGTQPIATCTLPYLSQTTFPSRLQADLLSSDMYRKLHHVVMVIWQLKHWTTDQKAGRLNPGSVKLPLLDP